MVEAATPVPAWWAKGLLFESCNCQIVCPGHIHFSNKCTHERCMGYWAIRLEEGTYGDVGIFSKRMNREGAVLGMIALWRDYVHSRIHRLLQVHQPEREHRRQLVVRHLPRRDRRPRYAGELRPAVALTVSRFTPAPPTRIGAGPGGALIRVPKGAGEAHEISA